MTWIIDSSDVRYAPLEVDAHVSKGLRGWRKRSFDILISLVLLIFLLPMLVAIAVAIKISDGGPVLFRHERRGLGGRSFTLLKFRTMRETAEDDLARLLTREPVRRDEWIKFQKLTQDPRVTPVGSFLRRTSLDEFPQLLNVLMGEMSLVGPRPVTQLESERFGDARLLYDAALPGITGLWQVSGRNDCTYAERVAMDARYVLSWSFLGDLNLIMKTIPTVLMRRGAY